MFVYIYNTYTYTYIYNTLYIYNVCIRSQFQVLAKGFLWAIPTSFVSLKQRRWPHGNGISPMGNLGFEQQKWGLAWQKLAFNKMA